MMALGNNFGGNLPLNQTFWVYMTAPIVGGLVAAFFNGSFHQGVIEGAEEALQRHHR
jgi:glycerol uptake facilitator-like aquaporin